MQLLTAPSLTTTTSKLRELWRGINLSSMLHSIRRKAPRPDDSPSFLNQRCTTLYRSSSAQWGRDYTAVTNCTGTWLPRCSKIQPFARKTAQTRTMGARSSSRFLEKNSRGTRDASERKFFHSIPESQESCTPPTSWKQRSHWPQFWTIHHLWNANETSTESPPRSSSGHLTQSPDLQWARTILRRNRFQAHRQNQRQNQKPNDRKRQSPTSRSTSDLRYPESSAVNWPTLKQHAIADRR